MKLPLYRPDAENTTRCLFFTGKGGAGKTSLSGATALKLAETGKRVLLVSTDPVSNLDKVLETTLANQPKPIAGAPGLHALNVNPSLLHSGSCDPLLQRREEAEHRYLREVVEKHFARTTWLPWQAQEPSGPDALALLESANLELSQTISVWPN